MFDSALYDNLEYRSQVGVHGVVFENLAFRIDHSQPAHT
jgi:hypothetical protein